MYDKNLYKRDVTCSWPPLPPVTNCHTFSDLLPLERDVLYGRPHLGGFRVQALNEFVLLVKAYKCVKYAKHQPNPLRNPTSTKFLSGYPMANAYCKWSSYSVANRNRRNGDRKLKISAAPTKAKSRDQLTRRRLTRIESIGRGQDPVTQVGRQSDSWWWMVFGVETGREVWGRGWVRIRFA